MASCKKCEFYSQQTDELNRAFNDVGNPANHYCPMYQDAIPEGVYEGNGDCEYYSERDDVT